VGCSGCRGTWEQVRARGLLALLVAVAVGWAMLAEIRLEGLRQQMRVITLVSPGISRQEVEYRVGPPVRTARYVTASGETGEMLRYTYRFLGFPMDSYWVLLDEKGEVSSVYYPWGSMASIHPREK